MAFIPKKLDGIHVLSLALGVALGYWVLPRLMKKG